MIRWLLNLRAYLDGTITIWRNRGAKHSLLLNSMFMYALSFYQCCLPCGWDVELERIAGDEKAFPEFSLCEPCGQESEARGKSIKDSRDRFQQWWWRDLDSLTFSPTRFQGFHELGPKVASHAFRHQTPSSLQLSHPSNKQKRQLSHCFVIFISWGSLFIILHNIPPFVWVGFLSPMGTLPFS